MIRTLVVLSTVLLVGCASQPKYREMRTLEDAAKEEVIKPGMAITKSGAVLHIDVEEVQAREKRLIEEKASLEQALKNLKEEKALSEEKYRTLRIFVGLSPYEPKAQGKCCDASGNLEGYVAPPSLNDELASIKTADTDE